MSGKVLHEENSRTILTLGIPGVTANKTPQYVAAILATLSAFASGVCLSWSSAAPSMLKHPDSQMIITEAQESWVGSVLTLGACVGAIPAGSIVNIIGRKRTLQLLGALMLVSWILIGYSTSIIQLYCGRILAGACIGIVSVAAPLYVSELAESRVRGALGTLFQLQMTIGILFEYIIGGVVTNFFLLALISATAPIIFLLTFSFMPESPVYLCSKGKHKSAKAALQWFRGSDYDIEDEYTRLSDSRKSEENESASITDLLQSKATIKALIISIGLMAFQQFSCINAIIFYAKSIFHKSGSAISPEVCTIIVGVVQVIATYISTLLMDRAGRRVLLLISDSIMSLCLIVLSSYVYFQSYLSSAYSFIPVACVALFVVVFSLGFGPIPWLMMGEIFPGNVKGPASSLAASLNWIFAFTVTKMFEPMNVELGDSMTYGIFAIICILGFIFVYCLVPETKGKSMEQIQAILNGQVEEVDEDDGLMLSIAKGTKVYMTTVA